MSFNIKFRAPSSPGTACAFKAPFIYNYSGSLDPAIDTAATPWAPTTATPLPSVLGDTHFAHQGCDDFILKVEHYDDGDNQACDSCPAPSTSTPTTVESFIYLPSGSSFDVPGYIVDYELVHVPQSVWTGDPEADYALAGTTVDTNSIYVASCRAIDPCCVVPDVVNADAVTVPGDVAFLQAKGATFAVAVKSRSAKTAISQTKG